MTLERWSSDQFVDLATAAGLPLTADVIDAMSKRGLLAAWPNDEYGLPHLFLIALYFDAIRVYRHPWAVSSSDVKLETVKMCNRVVSKMGPLMAIENDAIADDVSKLAREVEAFMNRVDPFGPIGGLLDFLNPESRSQLTGAGRIYAEVRAYAFALAAAVERVEEIDAHVDQTTVVEPEQRLRETADMPVDEFKPTPAQETREIKAHEDELEVDIDVPVPEEESISSEPTDDVTIEDPRPEAMDLANARAPTEPNKEPVNPKSVSPTAPAQASSEPQPESTDEPQSSEGFSRDGAQFRTARTQDLLNRLKNLKTDDTQDIEPADLEAQIAELNRQRESLMKNQNWEGLVGLYESKIELFPSAHEKQQVFLTLAQIQEIKLKDPQRAFEFFQLAIEVAEGDPAMMGAVEKAYSGLQRVGSRDTLSEALIGWLESRIEHCPKGERPLLQHSYSSALREAGEKQRAFLSYAAFLTEKPEDYVDVQTLEGLEDFASEVDDTELESFFQDLLEQDAPDDVQVLVATRAGLYYSNKNPIVAVRYFRLALENDPRAEVAYNNLSHIYQEERNWPDLVELASKRWAALPPPERQQTYAQISNFVDQDIEESDDAFDRYRKAAEEAPDSLAIDWAIRAFLKTGRFTEAYAFLNRVLDQVKHLPRRVLVLKTLAELAINQLSAPEEAILHYQTGLEIAGPRRDLLEGLASIRIESGSWQEAVYVLDTLTGGDVLLPDDARLHWLIKGVQVAEQASKVDAVALFKTRIATIDGNHELLR